MRRAHRDRYSRFVALLRVVLPLAAVGLLSTLFLLSRDRDTETAIPFAEADLQDRSRSQQVTAPFFSGVTATGHEISLTAKKAHPEQVGELAAAVDMSARLRMTDGLEITMRSQLGEFDMTGQTARFTGDVEIKTSSGYVLRTETLHTSLNQIEAETEDEVTGNGPMGQLDAGGMRLTSGKDGENLHLLFTNGVKLVYRPKTSER